MDCKIAGCGKHATRRGWCKAHYLRWYRNGDPLAGKTGTGEALRYFREVVLTYEGDDCLKWPYARGFHGYGQLKVGGRTRIVPRLVCEEQNGPPPSSDYDAAHSCGKGHLGCVTKRHLSWKTPAENMADKIVHGTQSRGERHGSAKLSEAAARTILARKGIDTQRHLAERFGVSVGTVSLIHQGKNWAWLNADKGVAA